jgi:hypothetical protein
MFVKGKNPNSFITIFLRRIVFIFLISSRVFSPSACLHGRCWWIAYEHWYTGGKAGLRCPRGSKNKSKGPVVVASSSVPAKRRPGRPVGSKNKAKVSTAAPGPSAPPHNASPPPSPKIRYAPSSASPALNATRFSGCR